ncbi:MAG TPA: hypothetical protein VNW15_02975 [Rhizomicrobium sp.]|nr:hypothetical protein [Rhizomicrobium sp.]
MSDASIPSNALAATRRQDHFMPAGVAILAVLFLGVAYWNGFPLMFYDTGAYLEEGLSGAFLVERSPVYSFLLRLAGGGYSLWPVVILQSLMTAYVIALLARIEVPRLALGGLVAAGVALMALTGIGWYVGQVEPDCMTPLVLLGCYLLLFRNDRLDRVSRPLVIAITALAVASHPSHLGLIGGLLLVGAGLRGFARLWPQLPRPDLKYTFISLAIALGLILASNFVLARSVFISRSGPVFVFARLMQDGIIQRLLNDTCPASGYDLCPYRSRLPYNANAWLWGENSLFHREGGFAQSQVQDDRMIADSLARYPLMHLKAALYDSVLQFFTFRTGDGIESQERILRPELLHDIPGQFAAFRNARQQRQKIRFEPLNMIHVTVGMLSLLGLLLLLHQAVFRGRWNDTALPGLVLAGLIGNAIICGTFSNPHDRYQSRIIWLPALVLLLTRSRDPHVLEPAEQTS